jgi:hypothetical protein
MVLSGDVDGFVITLRAMMGKGLRSILVGNFFDYLAVIKFE